MSTTTNRRKVLVPLATLLAAGAVAIGSGATFTSTTASTTSVASGNVQHTNDVTKLDIANIKPGDVITGSVTVTNTGSLPSTLTLREKSSTSNFVGTGGSDLNLKLTQGATTLYNGAFGGLADDTVLPLGALPVGGAATVTWTVTLTETTNNTNEGKNAAAAYEWVSTQTAGENRGFVASVLNVIGD